MPELIVEDGTCLDGANSYTDLLHADLYCVDRGMWPYVAEADPEYAADSAKKETALLRAADWLNGLDWKGETVSPLRIMAWPRRGVVLESKQYVDENKVPLLVRVAQCEIAAAIFNGLDPLAPQQGSGEVVSESVSSSKEVGSLSKSESRAVTYKAGTYNALAFPLVENMLRSLLNTLPSKQSGGRVVEIGRG